MKVERRAEGMVLLRIKSFEMLNYCGVKALVQSWGKACSTYKVGKDH